MIDEPDEPTVAGAANGAVPEGSRAPVGPLPGGSDLGRRRRPVALIAAIGVVAAAGYIGIRQSGDERTVPPPTPTTSPAIGSPGTASAADGVRRAAAGSEVLAALRDAVLRKDRRAFDATMDEQADNRTRRLLTNLNRLPVEALDLRYVGDDDSGLTSQRRKALGGTDAWVAQVEMSWRLRAFDPKPARLNIPVTLVSRGAKTYVVSITGSRVAGERVPAWLLGDLSVAKGSRSLVIAIDQGSGAAKMYAEVLDRAISDVTDVWGRNWRQRVVLYLPKTQQQMERVLGARAGSYSRIAAVTTAEADRPAPDAPVRIVANPKLFADLGEQGRRIVLTHETVHVASTATASPVPLWLAEGFADYVAFKAVKVPTASAANELFRAIRAGRVPKELPGPAMFAASSDQLAQAYESSWLACRLIADEHGTAKLVRFYRAVHASKADNRLAVAFQQVLGTTQAKFVRDWQAYLRDLADA